MYGIEEVSSLLAWGYYINNRKFCYKGIKRFYRIPYQNIAGDIGFYIYQQIYPFYGFCLILATYGFPIIISKMVAERLERGKQQEAEEIICVSFWFLLGIGFVGFLHCFWCRSNCNSHGRYTLR